MGKKTIVAGLISWMLLMPLGASALDTTETFDVGFTDVELYFGAEGIGKGDDSAYSFTPLLGIGLIDRLSLAIETSWNVMPKFYGSISDITMTIFGTPVDTEIFDLDLWVGASDNFIDDGKFSTFVGGEINVDFKPAGFYIRPDFGWTKTIAESEEMGETAEEQAEVEEVLVYSIVGAVGAYANVGEKIQIFAEYGQTFERTKDDYEDVGKYFAVGLNWAFLETTELITEVGWSTDNEEDSYFASIGFIFAVGQK